jgi:DNA repair exonuclease SbcCD ATPase subunit
LPQTSLDNHNLANTLAQEAMALYNLGNYSGANSKIIQSLQKFKAALTVIYQNTNPQQSDIESFNERVTSLKSTISRCTDQLRQIERSIQVTTAMSVNVSLLKAQIATVNTTLNNATDNLQQNNLDRVEKYLHEAKNLITRLTDAINTLAVELKAPKLESYINHTETRLINLRQEASITTNTASLTALKQAENSVTLAKDYYEKQLFNQTVAALMEAKESEKQAVEALRPNASVSDSATAVSPTTTSPNVVSPNRTNSTSVSPNSAKKP